MEIHLTEHSYPQKFDDRYHLVRTLGEGVTGRVYVAEDTSNTDSLVALKILHPYHFKDEGASSRFRTETKVTMGLSHPNILTTYGLSRTSRGDFYLKMEFISGCSLKQHLLDNEGENRKLNESLTILGQIASGLCYAHECGVLHRDLKPENILISDDGRVKILDFGLAQLVRTDLRSTGQGKIIGTPQYMSPEQFRGELLDNRSDLYAFGVICYEVLTGRPPFTGQTLWNLAELHLNTIAPKLDKLRPDLPSWVSSLVDRLLAKNRRARPQSMREVLIEFERNGYAVGTAGELPRAPASAAGPENIKQHFLVSRRFRRLVGVFGISVVLSALMITPRENRRVQEVLARPVFSLENTFGYQIYPLRWLVGIPTDLSCNQILLTKNYSIAHLKNSIFDAGYSMTIRESETEESVFHLAVVEKNILMIDRLVDAGTSPNLRDKSGRTVLWRAAETANEAIVERVLKAGGDPNQPDHDGTTPLHVAAQRGGAPVIALLLRQGALIEALDSEGNTPLHLGVRSGSIFVVHRLLAAGASPSVKNQSGQTPLDLARSIGNSRAVQLIERHLENSLRS